MHTLRRLQQQLQIDKKIFNDEYFLLCYSTKLCVSQTLLVYLIQKWTESINGCDIPLFLIGDPPYPLLSWLVKRYTVAEVVNREQLAFNYRLSRARNVVEGAFGRLKGRFRCLLTRNNTTLKYLPSKIASCCVLHNLCETRGDGFHEEWLDTVELTADESFDFGSQVDTNAQQIRDALTEYFKTR